MSMPPQEAMSSITTIFWRWGAGDGMMRVELAVDPPIAQPAQDRHQRKAAKHRFECARIPSQDSLHDIFG